MALIVLVVVCLTATTEASHNRSGHIHWSPGAEENQIRFVVQNAWRRDGYDSSGSSACVDVTQPGAPNTSCSGPDGHPMPGDIIHEGIGSGHVLHTGDGNSIGSPRGQLLYLVTSVDVENNWLFGVAIDPANLPVDDPSQVSSVIRHTYAAAGNYTAWTQSCCRISGSAFPNRHINNPTGSYRFETLVNVGTENNSPVSLMSPIVFCHLDAVCEFPVPAVDPDGDQLQFRLATPSEAGGGFNQPGPPDAPNAAEIDPDTGIYTWDTTDADLDGVDPTEWNVLYSTQVVVEDLDDNGQVKSKVVVDFFIQLVPQVGEPPQFNEPSDGEPITIQTSSGETVTFPLTVTGGSAGADAGQDIIPPGIGGTTDDMKQPSTGTLSPATVPGMTSPQVLQRIEVAADDGAEVTLNVVGLPPGAVMDPPLPLTGKTVSTEFTWTPSDDQTGTFIILFTATVPGAPTATLPVTIVVDDTPLVPGDLNGDDVVDLQDLAIFMDAYGSCDGDPNWLPEADYTGSGCINILDLDIWHQHFQDFNNNN